MEVVMNPHSTFFLAEVFTSFVGIVQWRRVGEAEAGSAAEQPDQGILGLRVQAGSLQVFSIAYAEKTYFLPTNFATSLH